MRSRTFGAGEAPRKPPVVLGGWGGGGGGGGTPAAKKVEWSDVGRNEFVLSSVSLALPETIVDQWVVDLAEISAAIVPMIARAQALLRLTTLGPGTTTATFRVRLGGTVDLPDGFELLSV